MRWIKLSVLLVLSAVGARAAELFDCIPEQAALAVRMRTARFFAAEPLRALTESGDVSRIREELALIPWDGGLPDAVLLYFGATQSYAVLVECRTEPEELKRKILRKYEKNPNVSLRQLTERGFPVLRLSFTRPDKPGRIKNYDLVRLADDVVLMAGNRNPTPWEALDRRYSSAMGRQLRQAPEALLLFGVCDDPGKLGIDPLGMTRRMRSFSFSVFADAGRGIELAAEVQGTDSAAAQGLNTQFTLFSRLLFGAFFGAYPDLMRRCSSAVKLTVQQETLHLSANFSPETLAEIRTCYVNDSDRFNRTLESSLISGGSGKNEKK